MLQTELIAEYLKEPHRRRRLPRDVIVDARWREGIGILEQLVICPRAPRGWTGLANGAGAN